MRFSAKCTWCNMFMIWCISNPWLMLLGGDLNNIASKVTEIASALTLFTYWFQVSLANVHFFNYRFKIWPRIHVHVASGGHFGGLWCHGGLQRTLEVKADLKIEFSDLNYLCCHASLACKGFPEMIPTTTANYDSHGYHPLVKTSGKFSRRPAASDHLSILRLSL